ncbi:MAG: HD-GYP domain-containing protein [Actinomycetota bacterium]
MVSAARDIPVRTTERARSFAWRHGLLVVLATSAVTILPVLGARAFEVVTGLHSVLVSLAIGVVLSLAVSVLGARWWSSFAASQDTVFGELMVWGWVRRRLSDARLARASELLGLDGRGWSQDLHLSPEEQGRLLRDLARTLELRDPYTHGHTTRVTRYSNAIARELALSPSMVENVRVAASLHDVGKVHVPLEVLRKTGALTDAEFDAMKQHAAMGAEMVERLGSPEITAMVRHHHERMDGRGYPDRLSGDDIPLGARIIAVADTFDAICSTRSYRKASNHKKALSILKKEAGAQLDRAAVDAFVTYYSGRGSFEWRVSVTTIPQRLLGSLGRSVPTGVVQGAAAAIVAVGIAHAPVTIVPESVADSFGRGSPAQSVPSGEAAESAGSDDATVRSDDGAGDADLSGSTSGIGLGGATGTAGLSDALGPGSAGGSGSGDTSDTGPGSAGGGTNVIGGVPTGDSAAGDTEAGSQDPGSQDPGAGETKGDDPGGATGGATDAVDSTIDDTTDVVDETTGGGTGPVTEPVDEVVDETTDVIDEVVDETTETVDDLLGDPPLL